MSGGRDRWSRGASGRLAGSGMSGGRIEIDGDAGDLVGAPLPGEIERPDAAASIHIRGSAGARAGDRMRRGLIAIEGDAGDNARKPHDRRHDRLLRPSRRPARLPHAPRHRHHRRRRGQPITPTFIDTGVHELVALRLIARWLIAEGIEGGSLARGTAPPPHRRHRGAGQGRDLRARDDGECDEPSEHTGGKRAFRRATDISKLRPKRQRRGRARSVGAARTKTGESRCRLST